MYSYLKRSLGIWGLALTASLPGAIPGNPGGPSTLSPPAENPPLKTDELTRRVAPPVNLFREGGWQPYDPRRAAGQKNQFQAWMKRARTILDLARVARNSGPDMAFHRAVGRLIRILFPAIYQYQNQIFLRPARRHYLVRGLKELVRSGPSKSPADRKSGSERTSSTRQAGKPTLSGPQKFTMYTALALLTDKRDGYTARVLARLRTPAMKQQRAWGFYVYAYARLSQEWRTGGAATALTRRVIQLCRQEYNRDPLGGAGSWCKNLSETFRRPRLEFYQAQVARANHPTLFLLRLANLREVEIRIEPVDKGVAKTRPGWPRTHRVELPLEKSDHKWRSIHWAAPPLPAGRYRLTVRDPAVSKPGQAADRGRENGRTSEGWSFTWRVYGKLDWTKLNWSGPPPHKVRNNMTPAPSPGQRGPHRQSETQSQNHREPPETDCPANHDYKKKMFWLYPTRLVREGKSPGSQQQWVAFQTIRPCDTTHSTGSMTRRDRELYFRAWQVAGKNSGEPILVAGYAAYTKKNTYRFPWPEPDARMRVPLYWEKKFPFMDWSATKNRRLAAAGLAQAPVVLRPQGFDEQRSWPWPWRFFLPGDEGSSGSPEKIITRFRLHNRDAHHAGVLVRPREFKVLRGNIAYQCRANRSGRLKITAGGQKTTAVYECRLKPRNKSQRNQKKNDQSKDGPGTAPGTRPPEGNWWFFNEAGFVWPLRPGLSPGSLIIRQEPNTPGKNGPH